MRGQYVITFRTKIAAVLFEGALQRSSQAVVRIDRIEIVWFPCVWFSLSPPRKQCLECSATTALFHWADS